MNKIFVALALPALLLNPLNSHSSILDSFKLHMLGFYGQRCGIAVSFNHHDHTFSHEACHQEDGYTDYVAEKGKRDGGGGWHDAGDYGKYIVNSAVTVGMMMLAWEQFRPALEHITLPIPETGGNTPDYLDEIRWNLEWMLKMQAKDGSVYHKLTARNFSGFIMPSADKSKRYFVPWGSPATAGFAASMAQASRVYLEFDPRFAQRCRSAAIKAWAYLELEPNQHDPDMSGFNTGGYSTSDPDDRLWAAAELWRATHSQKYLDAFERRARSFNDLTDHDWDWGNVKNLGMIQYALGSAKGRDASLHASVVESLEKDAYTLFKNYKNNKWGRALDGYYWGVNGSIARTAILLSIMEKLRPNPDWGVVRLAQIKYLYGNNVYGRSLVTGEGPNPPMHPHHRPSGADRYKDPWPGLLVGGGHPGPADWVDEQDSYRTNETAINWSGAMVYLLASALPASSVGPAGSPTVTPTVTATFSITPTFSISPTITVTPTITHTPCASEPVIAVNAGGPKVSGRDQTLWNADQEYKKGSWGYTRGVQVVGSGAVAGNTEIPGEVLQSERYDGQLEYRFDLPEGIYQVEMTMGETYFDDSDSRIFSLELEGKTIATDIDLFARAGKNKAVSFSENVPVLDGTLDIMGSATVNNAKFSAIKITRVEFDCR